MERTASRRTAMTITLGIGLAATVIICVWLAIDHATANSVAAHVTELYGPHGEIPDPVVPWIFLYGVFVSGAVCWAIALYATWRDAKWARWFSTACLLAGGAVLVFAFLVSEYGTPILPTGWRVVSLGTAGYGLIALLIAWLPTTDRITA